MCEEEKIGSCFCNPSGQVIGGCNWKIATKKAKIYCSSRGPWITLRRSDTVAMNLRWAQSYDGHYSNEKRGQFRLHKIGQSRTQPAGKLVFKAAYRQWNFRDWRGGDAAHLSPNFMRTNSVSLEDGFTASPRHWLIAYGSFRL